MGSIPVYLWFDPSDTASLTSSQTTYIDKAQGLVLSATSGSMSTTTFNGTRCLSPNNNPATGYKTTAAHGVPLSGSDIWMFTAYHKSTGTHNDPILSFATTAPAFDTSGIGLNVAAAYDIMNVGGTGLQSGKLGQDRLVGAQITSGDVMYIWREGAQSAGPQGVSALTETTGIYLYDADQPNNGSPQSDLLNAFDIIVTGPLTTDQRQLIEGYLSWKWWGNGTTVLPSTHPYYSTQPNMTPSTWP